MKMFFLLFVFAFQQLLAVEARAELDPRVKAVSTLALYGTVGGALLGAATMAYGTSSRSIFKGASLGLYAGLLFGSYAAVSHYYKQKDQGPSETYPEDAGGPYQEDESGAGVDYSDSPQRWDPLDTQRSRFFHGQFQQKEKREGRAFPAFSFELFRYQF